jgi:sporulation protein YlmC with PRC-barrel domain
MTDIAPHTKSQEAATLYADPRETASGLKAQTPIAGIDHAALAGSARTSKLIGNYVYKGDVSIGQIEDVLVDLNHGSTTAVILSLGGFLGIGEKLVAIPVNQIKSGSEAKFMTELTEEQLAGAPAFDFEIVDQRFPRRGLSNPIRTTPNP